jgi:hypothetical protein
MHLPRHLLVAAVAASLGAAASFSLPPGTPDGFYMTYVDSQGKTQIKSLPSPVGFSNHNLTILATTTSIVVPPSQTSTPPNNAAPASGCRPTIMCASEFSNVSTRIRARCNTGEQLNARTKYTFKYQSAMFYICVYSKSAQRCVDNDVSIAIAQIEGKCGKGLAGWYTFSSDVVFGFDNAGSSVC